MSGVRTASPIHIFRPTDWAVHGESCTQSRVCVWGREVTLLCMHTHPHVHEQHICVSFYTHVHAQIAFVPCMLG